mmetsp:Transcript_135409/g.239529  ORF Transcript_135409/g.239529 Transcript_135409/m.239529 type:complete len:177 (-) Transcript_135409:101-631(-)
MMRVTLVLFWVAASADQTFRIWLQIPDMTVDVISTPNCHKLLHITPKDVPNPYFGEVTVTQSDDKKFSIVPQGIGSMCSSPWGCTECFWFAIETREDGVTVVTAGFGDNTAPSSGPTHGIGGIRIWGVPASSSDPSATQTMYCDPVSCDSSTPMEFSKINEVTICDGDCVRAAVVV